jgi:hypothetical protein
LLAVVGLVVPAACGSGGNAAGKSPVRLGPADEGRTVTLGLGRRAVVRLDQPEWAFPSKRKFALSIAVQ